MLNVCYAYWKVGTLFKEVTTSLNFSFSSKSWMRMVLRNDTNVRETGGKGRCDKSYCQHDSREKNWIFKGFMTSEGF